MSGTVHCGNGVDPPPTSRGQFDVVVVGASLGGVTAVGRILAALPADFPAPIVVAMHRGGLGQVAEVWQRRAKLRVRDAAGSAPLLAGAAYVSPPRADLFVTPDRNLVVSHLDSRPPAGQPSIDLLFQSAATVYGSRCIGVVLTGMLHDGARGIAAIKMAGGRALAESPNTARAAGMPVAAVATGCVDLVLPVEALGAALVSLVMVPGAAELFRVPMPFWA